MVAALGADVVEGLQVHRDELTVTVPPEYLRDVALYLRDREGYDFLSDVTAIDYLGYERRARRLLGRRRARHEPRRLLGQGRAADAPRRSASASHARCQAARRVEPGGHRRLRVQTLGRRRRGRALGGAGLPLGRLPRARGLRHVRHRVRRATRTSCASSCPTTGAATRSARTTRWAASPSSSRTRSDRDGDAGTAHLAAQGRAAADPVRAPAALGQPGPARDQHRARTTRRRTACCGS